MDECELLVQGGTVIDGTGGPPVLADVAVADGTIVGVGGEWRPTSTIDATGLIVAPGFIDVHAHDDLVAVRSPEMTAKLSQGVTTVVAGNCGISAAPLPARDDLPPPFPLLGRVDALRYPRVADYRAAVDAAGPAVNVALLAGHSSLRVGAMAELDRVATGDEVAAMRGALAAALDEGCIGMSSGVDYPPARAADIGEIVGVLEAMRGTHGAVYATHIRDESDAVVEALEEAIETARVGAVPLIVSHHKCAGPANYGRSRETLARIEAARAAQEVALDVYPYVASSTSLMPEFVAFAERTLIAWSRPHPEMSGRDLGAIAAAWGCERDEAIERLSPAAAIYFQMDADDVDRIITHPAAMVGSDGLPSKGRPHPRLWGTFPRVLSHYVRERQVLSLVEAVHKMTGLPASRFPLGHRGVVEVGAAADLVVFDAETVADTATFDDPEQPAAGIHAVVVGGCPTWLEGAATGDRNGRLLTLQG